MAQAKRAARSRPTFIEEARRKQILEISREIFLKQGFEKTSIAEIAEAVGVSKGVVLYHFGNKSDLGKAVLEHALTQYSDFTSAKLQEKRSALARLLAFPQACAEYVETHRDAFLLYIDTLGCFGSIQEKRAYMAEVNRSQRERLIGLVEECRKEGANFRARPQVVADVMQAFVDGLLEQYCADPDTVDPKACVKQFNGMMKSFLNE